MECIHNARIRYTSGFYCEDCKTFFGKDTPTYRKDELLDSIWMVLNNINANRYRAGLEPHKDVADMKERIGIYKDHSHDYEEIIAESEVIVRKYGNTFESADFVLG